VVLTLRAALRQPTAIDRPTLKALFFARPGGGRDNAEHLGGWTMHWPRSIDRAAARELFLLLLRVDFPPAAIVQIFRCCGIVFRHEGRVFIPLHDERRPSGLEMLGSAVAMAAILAVVATVLGWLDAGPWRAILSWLP
jgi:hypothetical protein